MNRELAPLPVESSQGSLIRINGEKSKEIKVIVKSKVDFDGYTPARSRL